MSDPPASTARSIALFRAFLHEQDDPDRFYGALAADSVSQLAHWSALPGARVLDVGGGPGYFADAFRAAGASYLAVDPDVGEMSARGAVGPGMVRASGNALPVRTGSVDLCFSSNVLEHVADPLGMAAEMVRVTRPGGIVFLSFTPWLSPWGGHETAPWHYLGGHRAARRYRARHGHDPKNLFGVTLFSISAGEAIAWARSETDVDLLDLRPRYHPWWVLWVARIPWVREIASWNVALVLRRRS